MSHYESSLAFVNMPTMTKKEARALRVFDLIEVAYKDCTEPQLEVVISGTQNAHEGDARDIKTIPLDKIGSRFAARLLNSDRCRRIGNIAADDIIQIAKNSSPI